MDSQTPSDGPSPGRFPTTQWSRVIAAGDPDAPEVRESLAELCNAYWYPLYAYIRRRGHDPERARDLTQDFFSRIVEKGLLAEVDPVRGRFRSFLRTVCAHFLANRRDVQPRLEAVHDGQGNITDVTISYPLDLAAQMLEYSGRR